MTASGKAAAALALHRFGFGPVGDSIAAIAGDPRGAVLADLDRANAGLIAVDQVAIDLPSSGQAARAVFDFRAEENAQKKLAQRALKDAEANGNSVPAMAPTMSDAGKAPPAQKPPNQPPPLPQQLLQNEVKARFDAATGADIGFVERLVWFWSRYRYCLLSIVSQWFFPSFPIGFPI
jgi:uncharacterized protein (DUF1800 family)